MLIVFCRGRQVVRGHRRAAAVAVVVFAAAADVAFAFGRVSIIAAIGVAERAKEEVVILILLLLQMLLLLLLLLLLHGGQGLLGRRSRGLVRPGL